MTVYSTALVNSNGEVFHFYHPSATLESEGDFKMGDRTVTRIHITEEISDVNLWIRTHYWKDGAWKTREDKTSDYYTWKDEAWAFDSNAFMKALRDKRIIKLSLSDWTQIADNQLSDSKKAEWVTYRQALRDVPANNSSVTDMDSVNWPTEPS
tara:strand:+ start:1897 stop:2355 length:459 start_codon:yes stop_codon:yes gene_type:complete